VAFVVDEIGNEFAGPEPDRYDANAMPLAPQAAQALEPDGQPLASMARMMFDKANVQQRLASLERAVDTLGHGLKDELGEIRSLLAELIREARTQRVRAHELSKRKRPW
jgi:hypothetical protein